VADADEVGRHGRTGARDTTGREEPTDSGLRVPDTDSGTVQPRRERRGTCEPGRTEWWAAEPDVGRVAHGVPARMDRLSALGNGVVPQCAELVGLRLRMLHGITDA
jgi:DNA (cytosine-5)-methyltransferase 1